MIRCNEKRWRVARCMDGDIETLCCPPPCLPTKLDGLPCANEPKGGQDRLAGWTRRARGKLASAPELVHALLVATTPLGRCVGGPRAESTAVPTLLLAIGNTSS